MTKKDVEEVKKVVSDGIKEATADIRMEVERHRIVLFGAEGQNGMNKAVQSHTEQISGLRLGNAKAAAFYSVLAGAGGLVGSVLVKIIFK